MLHYTMQPVIQKGKGLAGRTLHEDEITLDWLAAHYMKTNSR